jgi:hypothetical protein
MRKIALRWLTPLMLLGMTTSAYAQAGCDIFPWPWCPNAEPSIVCEGLGCGAALGSFVSPTPPPAPPAPAPHNHCDHNTAAVSHGAHGHK